MFSFLFDTTFNVSLAEYLFMAFAGAAVYGLIQYTREMMRALAGDMRHRREDLEPEPVSAEPVAVPEPEVVEATADPGPAAAPVEVVVIERPMPDLLPPAPPRRDEVPIFAQVPLRLPQYDSMDWRFGWNRPAVAFPTGSFPVVVLSDDIEGYQVSAVPDRQLEGFEVKDDKRKRFTRSDAEMSALAAAQGFPDQPRQRHAVVDAALAEVAGRLSKNSVKVDLEAGTVVVSQ